VAPAWLYVGRPHLTRYAGLCLQSGQFKAIIRAARRSWVRSFAHPWPLGSIQELPVPFVRDGPFACRDLGQTFQRGLLGWRISPEATDENTGQVASRHWFWQWPGALCWQWFCWGERLFVFAHTNFAFLWLTAYNLIEKIFTQVSYRRIKNSKRPAKLGQKRKTK